MRLIDADALKEELKGRGLLSAIHSLDNAPTVDAVPREDYISMERTVAKLQQGIADATDAVRTGKWIERNPKKSKTCRLVECSECGDTYIVNINIPLELWARGNKSFCGNCGAKMQREE